jgi:hypothetical protein
MSDRPGLGTGAIILHVLVSVVAAFAAGRLISGPVTGTLAATAVGVVSVVLFKWRQRRATAGLTTGQMVAQRLREVEEREAAVESVHARLAELEERLDFSERMLARQNERQPGERSDG